MASEFPNVPGQPPAPAGGGMIGRIQRLLLKPKEEWARIDAEPMTTQGILMGWVAPLAAIAPVATLIQQQVFPMRVFGVAFRPPLIGSVVTAILTWVLVVGMVYVWSLIIDALAPSFGGTKNANSALKTAAFTGTAGWLCGILGILPFLGILALLGAIYNIYLFWVGGPMLMKVPQDKAPGFVVVSIIVGFVAALVAGLIAGAVAGAMFAMSPGAATFGSPSSGTITVGDTSIDTGKLNEAAAKAEAAAKSMQASVNGGQPVNGKTVDPAALQNLLPGAVSGYNRTEVSSSGGGALGMSVSEATARFASSDQSFNLKITDTGAIGALAGMVNVNENKQTATGYEKTMMQDGNMVTEKWDSSNNSGTYSVLVAKRFVVEAEGSAPNIDTLKSAVASVNIGQLASLAS